MPNKENPAQIRSVFGENLRKLSQDQPSVTVLASRLGINRTQFNRYLSGESFPRPDILARICAYFKLDARILLEPLSEITPQPPTFGHYMSEFLVSGTNAIPQNVFPSGFYRFSRRSFIDHDLFVIGLVFVFRTGNATFLRGFETTKAMRMQSLPTSPIYREFRGVVLPQEEGLAIIAGRKNGMTSSFNYLGRTASFGNNFWAGYTTRTIPEVTAGTRATRLVYEYLQQDTATVLNAARGKGFYTIEDIPPFHRRLLRPDQDFA
ncbi:helix-turn-helix domain-containing protein [Sulfitobacter sp. HGT1]|uniref:helix-turn-helix domain-containing protein n=1 Tax=unclassified Sulfitobacter TaxID=196795 RepID=UPI001594D329|nr:helix-turn-helix transcriptional regulator [Sulfitobacter sp. HGT1]MBQ0804077.1 helix-turn-helix transcriptional regulator [Sulfitobacter sp.]